MRLKNSPSLEQADSRQTTKLFREHDNSRMIGQNADTGAGFTHFERIPDPDDAPTAETPIPPSPPQLTPDAEELRTKWPQYVGAARIAWGQITEEELVAVDGRVQQLAGLIYQRYAVTREEADMQVRRFLTKQQG